VAGRKRNLMVIAIPKPQWRCSCHRVEHPPKTAPNGRLTSPQASAYST
jgi:hypothetical protein